MILLWSKFIIYKSNNDQLTYNHAMQLWRSTYTRSYCNRGFTWECVKSWRVLFLVNKYWVGFPLTRRDIWWTDRLIDRCPVCDTMTNSETWMRNWWLINQVDRYLEPNHVTHCASTICSLFEKCATFVGRINNHHHFKKYIWIWPSFEVSALFAVWMKLISSKTLNSKYLVLFVQSIW